MTDRQAKQLALVASAKMVGSVMDQIATRIGEEFARDILMEMAERSREGLEADRRFKSMLFSGVGIPNRFLMLDSVTTVNEVRAIQIATGYRREAVARPLVFKGQGPRINEA